MSDKTSIEWTRSDDGTAGATWNPVTGCEKVSPGCDHCYAETFAERWRGTPGHHFEQGFDVVLRPERLDQPLRWRRPRRVFTNSMSDLFHDKIPDDYIARVFAVMHQAPQHTFQVLTKRHGRMRALLNAPRWFELLQEAIDGLYADADEQLLREPWPPRNVWLGVSVEDQKWADIRIPALLETPAAVRWLSCEPLLGRVDLSGYLRSFGDCATCDGAGSVPVSGGGAACPACGYDLRSLAGPSPISWVVGGGESGPGARPAHPDWFRSLRDQCTTAGVPYFHKQNGQHAPVADQPRHGDLWLAPDGATTDWRPGDGHIREGGGEFRWSGTRTVLVRRHRSKHDAGRLLDGVEWNQYPTAVPAEVVA